MESKQRRGWGNLGSILSICVLTAASGEDPPHVGLEEVSKRSGIEFRHHGGSPEKNLLIEQISGGVTLLDYVGDGWLDLYFVIAGSRQEGVRASNRFYRNLGGFVFRDETEAAGVGYTGCSMGDFEGAMDILTSTSPTWAPICSTATMTTPPSRTWRFAPGDPVPISARAPASAILTGTAIWIYSWPTTRPARRSTPGVRRPVPADQPALSE